MSTASVWRQTSDFALFKMKLPDHLSTVLCCASTSARAAAGVGSERSLLVRLRGQSSSAGSSAGRLAETLGGISPGFDHQNNMTNEIM